MKDRRRVSVAVALSIGAHGAVLAAVIGSSLSGLWPSAPVDVEITGMKLEDVTDLPLGGPLPNAAPPPPPPSDVPAAEPGPAPPPKAKPKPRPAVDALAGDDKPSRTPPRPESIRSYGPAGSRVTALLRVDRLRGTPYAPSLDALLMHLPDRRDLLEGTELDLYRDFDALLIATPNPLDPAVTFLAVRHRLTDAALREALERGARATGRVLKWRTERGRPFAERTAAPPGSSAGTSPRDENRRRRDERLILFVAPKLAVVTPPAYRSLILRGGAPVRSPRDGAGGTGGPSVADGAAGAAAGGAGGAAPSRDEHADWAALIRRIDSQDSIMPADAVAMLSVEDLFGGPREPTGPSGGEGGGRAATIFGLPAPRRVAATLGVAPEPFANVDVTFFDETEAARWQAEWPALHQKLRSNPMVVLTGFSGLIGRIGIERAGAVLHVRLEATELEMIRLLQVLGSQLIPWGTGG